MSYPTITTLPVAPNRNTPDNFSTQADAFVAALPTLVTEVNTAGNYIEGRAVAAAQSVTDATAQVALAVTQVGLATAQVALAADEVDLAADEVVLAAAQVALAEVAAAAAASSANFVGAWSGLTGALNIPASVSHSGSIWNLNANLANVTTSEPAAANTDWTLSGFSGVYADLSGKPTLGTAAALATGTTSGTIPVLGVGGILPSGVLPPTSTPLFDKSLFGGN